MRSLTRLSLMASALTVILGSATPAHALFDGSLAVNSCVAGKLKCIAKKKTCLLNCHGKALKAGVAVDAACVAKCKEAFDESPAVPGKGCFAKLEVKGGCGASVGDAATFEAKIDAHVQEIVDQLVPGGGAPLNACTAGKLGCVRKYDACLLGLVRKAAQKGTPIGDVAKCTRLLDHSSRSCIERLEARYCDPSQMACSSTATPCLTYDDAAALRIEDDAFVDDTIVALASGPHDMDTQRCSGDTAVHCTSAPGGVAGCGGGLGTCEFYFSAPLPQAAGGISTCQTFQWDGPISGTFDQATGASSGTAAVLWRVYFGGAPFDEPCPRCSGDGFPNDGILAGTCSGGPRAGSSCDGNRVSPFPVFGGTTSLDCPPNPASLLPSIPIDLSNTNDGTLTKTLGPGSPTCNGAPGKLCLCASCSFDSTRPCENDAQCAVGGAGTCTNSAGAPRQPNACIDAICTPTGGADGVCSAGPTDQQCVIETFRGCGAASDCPAPGDSCGVSPRKCFPDYDGNLGDSISAIGRHQEPGNGASVMTFVALSCMAPTNVSAVNTFNGFPGPARLQLTGIGQDDGGPVCPTQASFLPTSKGTALEVGWSGLGHDNTMLGQAKVTVSASCTGTHPNCACSYAGPIQNPNAP